MTGAIPYTTSRDRFNQYKNDFLNSEQGSILKDSANRLGITVDQLGQRERILKSQEDKQRAMALDSNQSKFMSPRERENALNSFTDRRYMEYGIGYIPGEGRVLGVPSTPGRNRNMQGYY